MERAEAAAGKIKAKVNADLEGLIHRDRVFLGDVCKVLGLSPTLVNMTQVAVHTGDAGIVVHEEYPKMVYPHGDGKPGVTVQNEQEEKALLKPAKAEHKAK